MLHDKANNSGFLNIVSVRITFVTAMSTSHIKCLVSQRTLKESIKRIKIIRRSRVWLGPFFKCLNIDFSNLLVSANFLIDFFGRATEKEKLCCSVVDVI